MEYIVRWKMVDSRTGLVVDSDIRKFYFLEHKLSFLRRKNKEFRKIGCKLFWEDL